MKRKVFVLLFGLAVLVLAAPVFAQSEGRDPAFEQEIYDRLTEIDPNAVPLFQQATAAMDSDDYAEAKELYDQVLDLAPAFPDALRRLSYVEAELGNTSRAVTLARLAVEFDNSALNRVALARALLTTGKESDSKEALALARGAVMELPDEPNAFSVLLVAGYENNDIDAIAQASYALVELVPDYALAHYFVGLLAADEGEWEKAERELLLAQELGMPPEDIQPLLDDEISSKAAQDRWLRRGIYVIGGWLVGMVVLFGSGTVLSKLTLLSIRGQSSGAIFNVSPAERLVRLVYRTVIFLTSIYYYISIPFLVIIVIGLTGAIFYGFLAVGRIPVRIALIIGLGALYTVYAVVRSLFVRIKQGEPGRPLRPDEAPRFWELTREVADKVGTRPVDAIYLSPGTEIGVMERGGFWTQLQGNSQRYLLVGLGALRTMTNVQFRAIMAHEYGHFSNRDTAGGGLALQVGNSIRMMAYGLAVNGQANWFNPAWLFVNWYYRIYLRITLGASRLQEVLADRYAALAYGGRNLADALLNVVRQSLVFDGQVRQEVGESVQQQRALQNLYILPELEGDVRQEMERHFEQIINRPTSVYDSHPAVSERIRLVESIDAPDILEGGDDPVIDLLPNVEDLQDAMTSEIQQRIRAQQG